MSFNFLSLLTTVTWNVTDNKISILYYFNNENINSEQILSLLNNFAETYGLNSMGWKLPFVIQVFNCKHWNCDYFKRVDFVVRKQFFHF